MPTQEKIETVEGLKASLDGVKTVMLAEYRGLTVAQLSDLRKQLKAVAAEYRIVKNRLARLAIASSSVAGLSSALTGPTGMVLVKGDPVSAAKTLQTFARINQALVVKVGVVDGQMLEPAESDELDRPERAAAPGILRRHENVQIGVGAIAHVVDERHVLALILGVAFVAIEKHAKQGCCRGAYRYRLRGWNLSRAKSRGQQTQD